MFTGIIEEVGTIEKCGAVGLSLKTSLDDIHSGDSVSVNGVCLTATRLNNKRGKLVLDFDCSPETMLRTNLKDLRVGSRVNLERALKVGDRFGGHMMTGHIEGTGKLVRKRRQKDSWLYEFTTDRLLAKYIVSKGSVGIDGVSLTVVDSKQGDFSIAVIPYTLSHTNLGTRRIGDRVNIEPDILAKYVEHLLNNGDTKSTTGELLRKHGFIH